MSKDDANSAIDNWAKRQKILRKVRGAGDFMSDSDSDESLQAAEVEELQQMKTSAKKEEQTKEKMSIKDVESLLKKRNKGSNKKD